MGVGRVVELVVDKLGRLLEDFDGILVSAEPEWTRGVAIRCIILDAAILESELELDVYGTDEEAVLESLRAV